MYSIWKSFGAPDWLQLKSSLTKSVHFYQLVNKVIIQSSLESTFFILVNELYDIKTKRGNTLQTHDNYKTIEEHLKSLTYNLSVRLLTNLQSANIVSSSDCFHNHCLA